MSHSSPDGHSSVPSEPESGSITLLVKDLQAGRVDRAGDLWNRIRDELVKYAEMQTRRSPKARANPDEVAQSVFCKIVMGMRAGRMADVHHRDELWTLVLRISRDSVIDELRRRTRQKRGGEHVHLESEMQGQGAERFQLEQFADPHIDPSDVESVVLELFDKIAKPELRRIAEMKMQGWTNQEIAAELGCVPRTISRKLEILEAQWRREIDSRRAKRE